MEKKLKEIHIWSKPQFNSALGKLNINDQNVEEIPETCFISINDTHGQWSESWFNEDHSNVIRLWFDDISSDLETSSPTNNISVRAFTIEQAQQILDFIEKNKNKKTFIVHCTAGLSRSSGVGLFINDYFGLDYHQFMRNNPRSLPNQHVLKVLNSLSRYKDYNF